MSEKASLGKHAANNAEQTAPLEELDSSVAEAPAGEALPVIDASWTPVVPKKRKAGKIVAGVLAGLILLAGGAYGIGYWYFTNHFYPNTTMAGIDVSGKTGDEVIELADSLGSNYTVTVKGDAASFTIAAKDVNAGVDAEKVVARGLEANDALRWPLNLRDEHDITDLVVEEFNSAGFEDELATQIEQFNETAEDPQDAFIEYDAEEKLYVIRPEVQGTKLVPESVLKTAIEGIVAMQPEVEITEDDLVPPEILSTDERLVKATDEANSYCTANLELVLGDTEIHATTIDSSQISKWVSISDEYEVAFDEEAMDTWVADLANSLNTVGSERVWTRPSDGAEFPVSGGIYGWEIDNESLISQVSEGIKEGTQGTIVVPTFTEGYTWNGVGEPDWGAVMDVDLGQQHARFFDVDGTLLWESDFVSGRPDGKHDTPPGVWRILYMESPATLKGDIQVATGQPEYETRVQYWMPFTYSGCGFHDATWQWAFGGTRYADGFGSHGCINLSYDAAEQLYGVINTGNAVIVHW